jgi:hypothetical protein
MAAGAEEAPVLPDGTVMAWWWNLRTLFACLAHGGADLAAAPVQQPVVIAWDHAGERLARYGGVIAGGGLAPGSTLADKIRWVMVRLRAAGLDSRPGGGGEIFADPVRRKIGLPWAAAQKPRAMPSDTRLAASPVPRVKATLPAKPGWSKGRAKIRKPICVSPKAGR